MTAALTSIHHVAKLRVCSRSWLDTSFAVHAGTTPLLNPFRVADWANIWISEGIGGVAVGLLFCHDDDGVVITPLG